MSRAYRPVKETDDDETELRNVSENPKPMSRDVSPLEEVGDIVRIQDMIVLVEMGLMGADPGITILVLNLGLMIDEVGHVVTRMLSV